MSGDKKTGSTLDNTVPSFNRLASIYLSMEHSKSFEKLDKLGLININYALP